LRIAPPRKLTGEAVEGISPQRRASRPSIESKPKMALSSRRFAVALLVAAAVSTSSAHEHHDDAIPEGEVVSPDPLVSWKRIISRI
jgi:hypothetical protein